MINVISIKKKILNDDEIFLFRIDCNFYYIFKS